jgi:uncharacterized membrane protein (DUF2068 family)
MKHRIRTEGIQGRSKARNAGLQVVAIFEGAKGVIVLLAGCGLLLLIHRDLNQTASELIRHLHMNPAKKYPQIFLDLAGKITDVNLWIMAFAAIMYSGVRFAEAVGLWLNRRWAEWFGFLSGGIYIPLEIYGVVRSATLLKIGLLIINTSIVLFLFYVVLLRRKRPASAYRDKSRRP